MVMESSPCAADMQECTLQDGGLPVRCGLLERLPMWAICVPLVVQWLALAIRYCSLTLPSCLLYTSDAADE